MSKIVDKKLIEQLEFIISSKNFRQVKIIIMLEKAHFLVAKSKKKLQLKK